MGLFWFAMGGMIVLTLIAIDRMLHPRQPKSRHPVVDYTASFLFGAVVLGSPMWLLFAS